MIHSLAEFLSSWLASPARESPTVRLFPAAGWVGSRRHPFPSRFSVGGLLSVLQPCLEARGRSFRAWILEHGLGFSSFSPCSAPRVLAGSVTLRCVAAAGEQHGEHLVR